MSNSQPVEDACPCILYFYFERNPSPASVERPHFGLWEGGKIPTISETRDLGLMLYDMDFSDPNDIQPMFFRAKLENGVIDLTNCEVVK